MSKKPIAFCCFLAALTVFSATLYRNGQLDIPGTDYGVLPTNAPIVGDVLTAGPSGAAWAGLTNILNGIGSVSTNPAPVNIASTGWTNTFGKTTIVYFDGAAITYRVKNTAGTFIYTNGTTLLGGTVILQPQGAVIINGNSVKGRATPL